MNRIILGLISVNVLLFCFEAEAQTFRTFTTTTQEITYTDRVLADGRTIVEAVINTVVVDLTHHPVNAEANTKTNESNETLFLTPAAATELKAAIAAAKAAEGASDTHIKETVTAEIDATDKVKDTSGNVLDEITHITIVNGAPSFNTSSAGTVNEEEEQTTKRVAFDTVVHNPKPIVSQN